MGKTERYLVFLANGSYHIIDALAGDVKGCGAKGACWWRMGCHLSDIVDVYRWPFGE